MTTKDYLFHCIAHARVLDSENLKTVSWFLNKMEKERRLDEVSIKFFEYAISNFKHSDVRLLINAYYFPSKLKGYDFYYAMRLLSLFLSSRTDDLFDNTRLNIIKSFIDEGDLFIDKEYRTLFMYDLHLLYRDDNELAYYGVLIDYKELIAFLNLNNMGFHSDMERESFNEDSFRYQLNFLKNFIANYNKRLIK